MGPPRRSRSAHGARWARRTRSATCAAAVFAASEAHAGTLPLHDEVPSAGATEAARAEIRAAGGTWREVGWDDLETLPLAPGTYEVRATLDAGADDQALQMPPCAGHQATVVDGHRIERPVAGAPLVVRVSRGPHAVVLTLAVGRYEDRIACGFRPRVGAVTQTAEGLGTIDFDSPHRPRGDATGGSAGGRAVVYVPPGHDLARPSALLVGAHPWNGSMWTYAAYAGLLREARARDVVLLMPSGLGNSLYTAAAEDEVLRAIDALGARMAIDRRRVSIWGASMGGAGATTIGFHNPDRFASVTSFFGDSKYDLSTYVRPILVDERGAHLVDALDVVENARSLPVWLVHGEDDRTSLIHQSELLAAALEQRGFPVRFTRVPGEGHSGALVARFLPEVVAIAAKARVADVARVSYRSVADRQRGAYGVTLHRASAGGDAAFDVERRGDGVHVTAAEGMRALELGPGALGIPPDGPRPPVFVDCAAPGLRVLWGSPP
jgi:dienelactone hydrolase